LTRRGSVLTASIALGFGLVTGLAACSSDSERGSSSITTYHEGDSISVANGDEFIIALEANPSTGYTWDAGSNPNVTFVSSKQVSAEDAPPGASGTQELTFKATKKGSSTLELAYARQFEGGVPPAQTASFDVTVT
jgi:inhibitor of cysteine peptidase